MRVLIMGLPGSGKTTLANKLVPKLNAANFDADIIRKIFNDWDFSSESRIKQATRMRILCFLAGSDMISIANFVCPTPETREAFDPHFIIWMDTIKTGRFEDTNKLFVPPDKYDIKIMNFNEINEEEICNLILKNQPQ